jgi:hypothetical protein
VHRRSFGPVRRLLDQRDGALADGAA